MTASNVASGTLVVHPLVLLSVTDHHARSFSRNSHKRVVGVLLGQDNGNIVNVANSFGIPFEEDEKDSKTWFLDHNYIEGMYEMFKKVNGLCLVAPLRLTAHSRAVMDLQRVNG
jgi:26S proteasome regulatory subunit N8